MRPLTDAGQRLVADTASRHGLSEETVVRMLTALINGGGTQAQFNIPELGGMGQWSRGGMTMVGDMFNNGLKARVDALCADLAQSLGGDAIFAPAPASQSQYQGDGAAGPTGGSSFFAPDPSHDWPAELGQPASQGAQNDMRYAFFPSTRRLAISVGGKTTVHDTGDHRIGGFGQAQGGTQSLTFSSQYGTFQVADLPRVDMSGNAAPEPAEPAGANPTSPPAAAPQEPPPPQNATETAPMSDEQIFARLEKLADLRDRGILEPEEFAAKKAELLARL
ncbi:SHOCT domain-containing protein [Roseisalinus antarcticus]|uniref:SHOCT domain-containing protein n=1 Tax=Roseisalinus antarcticus TaxID=254357 RepID=A0A1Y5TSC0_9RHOB|nr:SHOCT domain-containing protein [Roseisalinus antarcticus]SLN66857.1 hypothetical protein ROA7023_03182 [Roseisalinus antarcticus]